MHPGDEDEIAALRLENAALRAELAEVRAEKEAMHVRLRTRNIKVLEFAHRPACPTCVERAEIERRWDDERHG